MTALTIKQRALRAVQRSVLMTSLAFAADNVVASLRRGTQTTFDDHLGGADIEDDIAYAQNVAAFYVSLGPLTGKVAEIGPGGSDAVALFLAAQGCEQIDLVDRFAFAHDSAVQGRLYKEIAKRLASRGHHLDVDDLLARVNHFVGENAAAEIFFRSHRDYEAILSCAVLEHLYDPLSALAAMASAIRPGGRLMHQVDLRDHGMYTSGGHHELTYLSVPRWFYTWMSRTRGRPNRVPLHRYRQKLEELGLDYELIVTDLVGSGSVDPAPYHDLPLHERTKAEALVEELRPKLSSPYRTVPAADLAVAGFRIVARKPG